MKRISSLRFLLLGIFLLTTSSLSAAGTYSEGWTVAKLIQFESRGVIFESYEGLLEVYTINDSEACDEMKDECFVPAKQKIEFSVRPENADVVNFLSKSLNQEILVQYRIHRFEPVALSSDYEVVGAQLQERSLPKGLPDKIVSKSKTGGKRNFSVTGRILSLEYKGTMIGTWEGLYLDETRNKVHQFSITDEEIAAFATNTLKFGLRYFLGVSVAYVTGWRDSHYDIYEINFKTPAGALEPAGKTQ